MEKYNNDQIVEMLTLSEEISMINYKLKQLVQDLGNTQNVLGGLKELADSLNKKVVELKSGVGSYKAIDIPMGDGATASNVNEMGERERIIPTPENYKEYLPQPPVGNPPRPQVRAPQPPPLVAEQPVRQPARQAQVGNTDIRENPSNQYGGTNRKPTGLEQKQAVARSDAQRQKNSRQNSRNKRANKR